MSFYFPLILAIGITADSIIIGETSLKKYKFIFENLVSSNYLNKARLEFFYFIDLKYDYENKS